MPLILPRKPNLYTGSALDRAAHLRDQPSWIADAAGAAQSLWAPVWRGQVLLREHRAALLDGATAERTGLADQPWAFLGLLDQRPIFAVDLGGCDDPGSLLGNEPGAFVELRSVAGLLPAPEAALLAYARGLAHWRARHRYCGQCGGALAVRSGGHVLQCHGCASQHFPRTDPAVIMLVVHDGRALLAHSARFPTATMYSTLAGFVEPGESLEEAVAREVFEEAGVQVSEVAYHSSQPWPFPASLMVGFYAAAAAPTLKLDNDELTDARWFTRAEIREPERHGFMIPGVDSIARRLIEDWVESP